MNNVVFYCVKPITNFSDETKAKGFAFVSTDEDSALSWETLFDKYNNPF